MLNENIRDSNRLFIILSFLLGFTSIIGQIILLRELIGAFDGNETAYSVVLSGWLFWIAVGSLAASRFVREIKRAALPLAACCGAIYFILPSSVIFARFLKGAMGLKVGEIADIFPMCLSSYLLLAPLTVLLGCLFTLLCRFAQEKTETKLTAAMVYLWESVGAAFGGLVFSFILIHLLSTLQIAFLIGALNLGAIFFLLPRKTFLFKATAALLAVTAISYPLGLIQKFDTATRQIQWKGFEVVANADSIYGNITLTKMAGEYSLFENGLLSYSTKDELTSEENTHYALLEHPNPKNVLLIGNGIGGNIKEILKHPIESLDYVELDPLVIRLSQQYLPAEILLPLKDPRVHTVYTDARFFVKGSGKKYDVILVSLADPTSAFINRYYTLEFFKEASRILNPKGILALTVSSSENYLNKEARMFLCSINTTLKKAFADVKSIPGDTNIFLACKDRDVLTYDTALLLGRLKSRHIQTKFVREYYLPFKLTEDRLRYIEDILKKDGLINTDLRPITYFFDIILWSTHFNTSFKETMEKIAWIKLPHLMAIPLVLFVAGGFLVRRRNGSSLAISIVVTGLSQIIFQLIIILAFQTFYGYAYYKIGLIMSVFMAGLATGSFLAKEIIGKAAKDQAKARAAYLIAQCVITLYFLVLPTVFSMLQDLSLSENTRTLVGIFTILPFVTGFVGGLQYPLATYLLSSFSKNKNTAGFAGSLYAADTFGAAFGALLTGIILIPLLGIVDVSFFCAAINVAVFFILIIAFYPGKSSFET